MKKEGIQTRNRKASSKNRKGKSFSVTEENLYFSKIPASDHHFDLYSQSPGALGVYSHSSHSLPPTAAFHSHASLPYPYHPPAAILPSMVWRKLFRRMSSWKAGKSCSKHSQFPKHVFRYSAKTYLKAWPMLMHEKTCCPKNIWMLKAHILAECQCAVYKTSNHEHLLERKKEQTHFKFVWSEKLERWKILQHCFLSISVACL